MGANRYYFPEPFEEGTTITLIDEEFHHLVHVMRNQEGDTIELVNGQGALALAQVLAIQKRKGSLLIQKVEHRSPALKPLILVQALTKLSSLEWIIQKGTELGASAFYLYPGERSEKTLISHHQMKRLKHISIGAMKQCDRLDLPTITFVPSVKELSLPKGHAFFGDLRANAPPIPPGHAPYQLFIGPEKGFSNGEIACFKQDFNATGIHLHPYTLRADTAAIAALSVAAAHSSS